MQLAVLNAITAEISKVGTIFSYEFGDIWQDSNDAALNFVKEVEVKFRRKTKTYGFLQVDPRSDSIPTILKTFIATEGSEFEGICNKLMTRVEASLNEENRGNTQTGHVVFIHYCNEGEEDDIGKLLVVMVDKKDVFDFGAGLVPTQFKSIDVDGLRQAVMYDLNLFNAVYPDHVQENQEDAYLRFISGKSKGTFFQEALGTSTIIDNTVSISSIFDAVAKFAELLELPSIYIGVLQDEVELLIKEKKHKQISVSAVAKRVVEKLPDGHDDVDSAKFIEFVNENNYVISEIFDVTPNQLTNVTNIEGRKGQDYYYRVKKSALGNVDNSEKNIRYDSDSRILYIDILDDDKHNELLKAIETIRKNNSEE